MHFIVLLHGSEANGDTPTQISEEESRAWDQYFAEIEADGVLVQSAPLHPTSTSRTVRMGADGEPFVTDGPFAETKEQLGGFLILDCPDIETALSYASRVPCLPAGPAEVRAVLDGRARDG